MPIKFCPTHGIGYNPALDPVCPQCAVQRMQPPEALAVDENPESPGFGHPKRAGQDAGDRTLPKVR